MSSQYEFGRHSEVSKYNASISLALCNLFVRASSVRVRFSPTKQPENKIRSRLNVSGLHRHRISTWDFPSRLKPLTLLLGVQKTKVFQTISSQ